MRRRERQAQLTDKVRELDNSADVAKANSKQQKQQQQQEKERDRLLQEQINVRSV